tara:strand:+ start:478 stop:1002 length:525 start_codon:yes stop_codon:yes gene_type:complete
MINKKKIVYVDMDGVLVDFQSGIDALPDKVYQKFIGNEKNAPNVFSLMLPIKSAIYSFNLLSLYFDTYILSTSPWKSTTALQDKLDWVKINIGLSAKQRVIFSHHKNLNKGDYLIDDRTKRGADKFEGKHIHFGYSPFHNWYDVLEYLFEEIEDDTVKINALTELKKNRSFFNE